MQATIIAAADDAWGIGREGGLPWHIPDDLARFRARTMGRTVIVGRKTAVSLPNGLPGRTLLTVSASGHGNYRSVAAALEAAMARDSEEIFIAGGAGIYREAMSLCTSAEITRVPGVHPCDAFMPKLDKNGWHIARIETASGLQVEHWTKEA